MKPINLDLHIHSCYSKNIWGTKIFMPPSMSTPENIIKTAVKKGLRGVGIMDHDNVEGSQKAIKLAKKYKVVVMPGVEVSSKDGHILGFYVQENIKKGLSAEETIDLIKQQGGYPIPAHPFNISFSLSREKVMKLRKKLFAIEVYNGHSYTNEKVKTFADKYKMAQTGGSDAHCLSAIKNAYFSINQPINFADDIIKALKKKKTIPHINGNESVMLSLIPNSIAAFFYWQGRRIQKIFNPKIKLPF